MAAADRLPPGQRAVDGFPVTTTGRAPRVDRNAWRLTLDGLVDHPLDLSFGDLAGLPHEDVTADMHCVERWSALGLQWRGVPFAELAGQAKVDPTARFVRFIAVDGHDTSLPLDLCLAEGLVADGLDDAPVPDEHGGPVRMIVPSRYGAKQIKWLGRIEFLERDRLGFWELRGYHNGADVQLEERLL